MADEPQTPPKPPRPPLGTFQSRCDEKGRLRLPKDFEEFLRTFPDQEFFVTTLDGTIGRIYPIAVWSENKRIFGAHAKNPKAAADLARLADYFGAAATIDGQGRILVPPELRRRLGIENQPAHVRYYNDGVEIYSQQVLEATIQRALGAETTLQDLYGEGLK